MNRIAEILLDWYAREGRDLPWRRTRDPYRIWLSEVILQQTRVAQGMEYYLRFTERFPDVASLAAAPEDEVLKLWQGLGYYSRARNLRAAAREVVERFGGVFPRSLDDVRSLRGVGDYTAAAICSAAYDAPCAVVDGNVYRVLSRLFDLAEPIDTTAGKRAFACLAQSQLDAAHPGRYNQAIMDFGALQCTPANPSCNDCPLRDECLSLAAGTVAERPVKAGRTRIRPRYLNYLHLECGGRIALRRRPEGDIWQGLYDLPAIESDRPLDFTELAAAPPFRDMFGTLPYRLVRTIRMPKHQLSHQTLHAAYHRLALDAWPSAAGGWTLVPYEQLEDYAIPRLLDRYYADRRDPLVAFAGQMTGVEGYVESTASGFLASCSMAAKLKGEPLPDFPRETAIGALAAYISDESVTVFQPMNVNFGILTPLDRRVKGKANKNLAIAQRSLAIIDQMTGQEGTE